MSYPMESDKHIQPTPSLLDLVVNARISAFLMGLEIWLDRLGDKEFDHHREVAYRNAELAGYLYPDRDMPLLLRDVYELPDAWCHGQDRFRKEEEARERPARAAEKAAQLAAIVRGEERWSALDLPAPADAVVMLSAGKRLSVFGYSVWFEDGATWFTNPYGQDGFLGDEPNIEMMQEFLLGIARGEDYGLVPH